MEMLNAGAAMFLYLAVAAFSLFAFLAVAIWSHARRREREAFYRAETLKKVTEAGTGNGGGVLEFLREEAIGQRRRRREGLKLGGVINLAIGLGLIIYLRAMVGASESLVGIIPCLIGVVLLLYAYLMSPKER